MSDGTTIQKQQRLLAVKLEIDFKSKSGRALYRRILQLSWMASRKRNRHLEALGEELRE